MQKSCGFGLSPFNQEHHMAQIANACTFQAPLAQTELDMATSAKERKKDLGFELGWDFAHYGLTPPVEHLFAASALLQGWQAGRASFGERTLKANRHIRMCLQLRTYALMRGLSFESLQVTANYLQQIDTEHCPITRRALGSERSVDRVRHDAGYAAGNLVILSRQANRAKAGHGYQAAQEIACSVAAGPIQEIAGLGPREWARVATLCSFVTELPHEEAAQIPLLILPPNRLQLFNPIQALQALITRQLASPGWSQRLARLEALLPNEAIKADFNRFVMALVPRVLKASELLAMHEIRWALEDAWCDALVQKRWTRFALQLNSLQAESLIHKLAAKRLSPVRVQHHAPQRAIEGWALDRRGYRAPAARPAGKREISLVA
jgi:hypothetical protein